MRHTVDRDAAFLANAHTADRTAPLAAHGLARDTRGILPGQRNGGSH
jgi:hypothetical protein